MPRERAWKRFSVKMAYALLAVVGCCLLLVSPSLAAISIPDTCLDCLCKAISGLPTCPSNTGCSNGVCGPFAITSPYWQHAGRPTVSLEDGDTNEAFEKCAMHSTCATVTIREYMNKFHQDCNQDGIEDCMDYVHIHFNGGYSCNKPLSIPVRNSINDCLQRQGKPVPPPSVIPFLTNAEDPEYPDDKEHLSKYPPIDYKLNL